MCNAANGVLFPFKSFACAYFVGGTFQSSKLTRASAVRIPLANVPREEWWTSTKRKTTLVGLGAECESATHGCVFLTSIWCKFPLLAHHKCHDEASHSVWALIIAESSRFLYYRQLKCICEHSWCLHLFAPLDILTTQPFFICLLPFTRIYILKEGISKGSPTLYHVI